MDLFSAYRKLRNTLKRSQFNSGHFQWVFIYGMPRSGSTYLLHQFKKISRSVVGDWMMEDFALTFRRAEQRSRQTLNIPDLKASFRENLLNNSPPGEGSLVDICIKQQSSSYSEFLFLQDLFQKDALHKIFVFRDPEGWLRSVKNKFAISGQRASHIYLRDLETYSEIGGTPVIYEEIPDFLRGVPGLRNVKLENFEPTKAQGANLAPDTLHKAFAEFKASSYDKPWLARRDRPDLISADKL